jgi:inner membrane protein
MRWFVVFAAVVFGLYFWRQYRERQIERNSPLADHRLGLRHIGDIVVLEQGLPGGTGRVRLGNRDWPIRGPSLPAGSKVRVIGVDGSVLLVDRIAA